MWGGRNAWNQDTEPSILKPLILFIQMRVTEGFVSWPGSVDLSPDAMYEAIKQEGEWILS